MKNNFRLSAIAKTVLIKATGFDRAMLQMKNILTRTWEKESRQAIIETIRLIEAHPNATKLQIKAIQENLSIQLGQDFSALVNKKVASMNESAYIAGGKAAAHHAGATFTFGLADRQAVAALNNSLRYWVKDYYNDQVMGNLNDSLTAFFTDPAVSRKTLIEGLSSALNDTLAKSDSYWDMLADHTATKTREIGRVSGYEQAHVKRIQVRAHIDDRTTDICRRMNGKILSVPILRKSLDKHLEACKVGNKDQMKATWKWWSNKDVAKLSEPKLQRKVNSGQIFLPPYHARCRTITVAYFGD